MIEYSTFNSGTKWSDKTFQYWPMFLAELMHTKSSLNSFSRRNRLFGMDKYVRMPISTEPRALCLNLLKEKQIYPKSMESSLLKGE